MTYKMLIFILSFFSVEEIYVEVTWFFMFKFVVD